MPPESSELTPVEVAQFSGVHKRKKASPARAADPKVAQTLIKASLLGIQATWIGQQIYLKRYFVLTKSKCDLSQSLLQDIRMLYDHHMPRPPLQCFVFVTVAMHWFACMIRLFSDMSRAGCREDCILSFAEGGCQGNHCRNLTRINMRDDDSLPRFGDLISNGVSEAEPHTNLILPTHSTQAGRQEGRK